MSTEAIIAAVGSATLLGLNGVVWALVRSSISKTLGKLDTLPALDKDVALLKQSVTHLDGRFAQVEKRQDEQAKAHAEERKLWFSRGEK